MENCNFCDVDRFSERMIWMGRAAYSIVSNPSFRKGQCLVIPRCHVEKIDKLAAEDLAELMLEVGRLAGRLDQGHGMAVFQKNHPTMPDGRVKQSHLHIHVVPRLESDNEDNLFGTPRDYSEFREIDQVEIDEVLETVKLRVDKLA